MDAAILQFFEGIRNPVLTAILGAFSLLGEPAVISGIVILVFWLAPRRTGEQALLTVLTSYCLNSYMKFTAARPRPYVDGVVSKLTPPLSDSLDPYASFPSGHAQMTTGFFGALAFAAKRVLVWMLCILIIALVACARIYFGVHYPSDVLTGLVLGLLLATFWALVFRVAYRARYFFLLGFAAVFLALIPYSPSQEYLQAAGLLSGAAIALSLLNFTATYTSVSFPRRLWRIPVGLSLLLAAFALTLLFPAGVGFSLLKWFFLAFAGIFGGQLTFERLQI